MIHQKVAVPEALRTRYIEARDAHPRYKEYQQKKKACRTMTKVPRAERHRLVALLTTCPALSLFAGHLKNWAAIAPGEGSQQKFFLRPATGKWAASSQTRESGSDATSSHIRTAPQRGAIWQAVDYPQWLADRSNALFDRRLSLAGRCGYALGLGVTALTVGLVGVGVGLLTATLPFLVVGAAGATCALASFAVAVVCHFMRAGAVDEMDRCDMDKLARENEILELWGAKEVWLTRKKRLVAAIEGV